MTREWRRIVRLSLSCLVAALGLSSAAMAQVPFYVPQPGEVQGPPGSVIRQELVFGAPFGTIATRILYRTTSPNGTPIVASGIVIAPAGPMPPGGRPVIAWAHPTSGVVPRCAPSLALTFFQSVQGLLPMVERGYVVVAPDYPGLGTAGPHAYLIGDAAARAVLDSVRATMAMPTGAGNRFAVWGHSQGGHAALFTGLTARRYAPDLTLVGVAAAAPATDLGALLRDDFTTQGGKSLTAMALWSWTRVFDAPIEQVVAQDAIPTVNALAEICIESLLDIYTRQVTELPLQRKFLIVPDITRVEPWRNIMLRNSPGPLPRDIPVFIAQGTADNIVPPTVTAAFVRRQCRTGSAVRVVLMPAIGHAFIARDAAFAAVQWMGDRFAGVPPPSDCGR